MAAPVITCTDCRTTWHLVIHPPKVHPGNPNERGAFVFTGASAEPIRLEVGTDIRYVWTCLCGITLDHLTPAWERVDCAPNGQPCGVNVRSSPDSYASQRSRHIGACECCGLQGTHHVRKDRQMESMPRCLQ